MGDAVSSRQDPSARVDDVPSGHTAIMSSAAARRGAAVRTAFALPVVNVVLAGATGLLLLAFGQLPDFVAIPGGILMVWVWAYRAYIEGIRRGQAVAAPVRSHEPYYSPDIWRA